MAISALYAAVWDTSARPTWQARHGLTAAQYQSTFDQLTSAGYRLRMVSGYAPDSEDLYAALWDKSAGPAWQAAACSRIRTGIAGFVYQFHLISVKHVIFRAVLATC